MPVGAIDRRLRVADSRAPRRARARGPRRAARPSTRRLSGQRGVVERHRRDRQPLVAVVVAVGGAAMVADDAQHVARALRVVAGERPELAGHLGRGRVGDAGHDRGDRAADGAALGASRRGCPPPSAGRRCWRSRGRACGSGRRARRSGATGTAPSAPRFRARRSTAGRRARRPRCRSAPSVVAERQQVQRGEVAGRVVEEHVLRARVRRADRPDCRAGVPVVDGGVELDAGIGARPRRRGRSSPTARGPSASWRPCRRVRAVSFQSPSSSTALEELVGDAHRVVRVLAGDGEVGLASPSRCRRSAKSMSV